MKSLVIIVGPTASGKTRAAIEVARALRCEIVSADSRQVFQEMNIGTAKPDRVELSLVRHHFIDHVSIHENYTAGRFAREVRFFLEEYFLKHEAVVICGGTGLYVRALLEGMDRKPVEDAIRNEVRILVEQKGLSAAVDQLKSLDPHLAERTELTNPQRVMRSLEWVLAGKPISEAGNWPSVWKVKKIGLDWPRADLYSRINQRVDLMIENGLWQEATSLYPFRHLNALQTVGYQEIFDSLDGKITREGAIDLIKQHTRNYAKRQMTWFRKDPEIEWFSTGDQAAMVAACLGFSHGT